MLKQFFLTVLLVTLSSISFAASLWHCTATTTQKNTIPKEWNYFGITHNETRLMAEKECVHFNNHQVCEVICFPPRLYWRCVSHDTLPIPKENNPSTVLAGQPKQGSWYWTSFSEQIAINGARDACRHNSAWGGCYVDQNACASS